MTVQELFLAIVVFAMTLGLLGYLERHKFLVDRSGWALNALPLVILTILTRVFVVIFAGIGWVSGDLEVQVVAGFCLVVHLLGFVMAADIADLRREKLSRFEGAIDRIDLRPRLTT